MNHAFHAALARALRDNGVDTLFGVMGDGNIFVIDSFARLEGCRYVAATGEASAVLMALAYASVSGKAGVATVTHGPGLTNTISGLVEGVKGQLPLLLLCGDTAVEEKEHTQNVPQRELVVATGAGFEQVRSPGTLPADFTSALRRAHYERRPIVLNMPIEFMSAPVDYVPAMVGYPADRARVEASEDLDNAVGMIAAARRPVVIAGRGAVHARGSLLRLAERTGALLATTLKGKDLFLGEDYDIGLSGTLSSPGTVELLLESDCILAFGASLGWRTTSAGAFLGGTRLIQCNAEPEEIGRHAGPGEWPDAGLVGDPGLVADLIVHWLDEAEIEPSGQRNEDMLRRCRAAVARPAPLSPGSGDALDIERAISTLDAVFEPGRILVTDGGRFAASPRRTMRVSEPSHYVQNWNAGAIGFGLPSAIGAAFAAPEAPVLLVTGDGGLMLGGLSEFATALRHGVNLTVVICNDAAYGAEHIQFRERGMDPALSCFDWPEFAELARAFGGAGIAVSTNDDLQRALAMIGEDKRPLVIDLKLDPDQMPDRD